MGLEPDIDSVTILRHPMAVMNVKVLVRISYFRALLTKNAQVRKLQTLYIVNLGYIKNTNIKSLFAFQIFLIKI